LISLPTFNSSDSISASQYKQLSNFLGTMEAPAFSVVMRLFTIQGVVGV